MSDETTTWTAHGVAIIGLETTFETGHSDEVLAKESAREALWDEYERVKDDPSPLVEVDDVVMADE